MGTVDDTNTGGWMGMTIDADRVGGSQIASKGYAESHPEHRFVCAAQVVNGFAGPRWVPFNLYSQSVRAIQELPEYATPELITDCAKRLLNAPGAEQVWGHIADRYRRAGSADRIALELPCCCALAHDRWGRLRKELPKEHRASYERMATIARQLSRGFCDLFDEANREDWEGFGFPRLMTALEMDRIEERIYSHNFDLRNRSNKMEGVALRSPIEYAGDFDRALPVSDWNPSPAYEDAGDTWRMINAIVPDVPELLGRLASRFADAAKTPPVPRPNNPNAERNHFARALIDYFIIRYRAAYPIVVAAVVSIFFPQGITENDVSKLIARRHVTLPPQNNG